MLTKYSTDKVSKYWFRLARILPMINITLVFVRSSTCQIMFGLIYDTCTLLPIVRKSKESAMNTINAIYQECMRGYVTLCENIQHECVQGLITQQFV